jgi:hypothetical protein
VKTNWPPASPAPPRPDRIRHRCPIMMRPGAPLSSLIFVPRPPRRVESRARMHTAHHFSASVYPHIHVIQTHGPKGFVPPAHDRSITAPTGWVPYDNKAIRTQTRPTSGAPRLVAHRRGTATWAIAVGVNSAQPPNRLRVFVALAASPVPGAAPLLSCQRSGNRKEAHARIYRGIGLQVAGDNGEGMGSLCLLLSERSDECPRSCRRDISRIRSCCRTCHGGRRHAHG